MEIGKEIKSKFKTPQQKAFVNLRYTSNWILKKQNSFMSNYDLTMPQFNILRILRGAGEGVFLSVNTIKSRMVEISPNTTRLMDKLYEKKLIERERCPNDKRIVHVSISQSGMNILSDIDKHFDEELNMINFLSDEEAEFLSAILDRLRS
ncbi:MAG: MarR family winged helix-turn-helix transcriptional regulator [Crocinitomicaceae bacterium]|jgi:DNA-binding MarR family transcriptional regulator